MKKNLIILILILFSIFGCKTKKQDKLPPISPKIIGVENKKVYTKNLSIRVIKDVGVEYKATLNDEIYTLGSEIKKDGGYKLLVIAKKISNEMTSETEIDFVIEKKTPLSPKVIGVSDGDVSANGFNIYIEKEDGVKYSIKIDNEDYKLETTYSKEGKHILEVIATKTSNGLQTKNIINFEINKDAPKAPIIKGIKNGLIYSSGVVINVELEKGVKFTSKLNDKDYKFGDRINKHGKYKLEVLAEKLDNGLTSKKSVYFEIDKSQPKIPEIFGLKDGTVLPDYLELDFEKEKGVIYRFEIDGIKYDGNETYKKPGKHTLTIIAKKKRNGIIKTDIIDFEIDKIPPKTPTVFGVKEGEISAKYFIINIEKRAGEIFKAEINDNKYNFGNKFEKEGKHTLVVTAIKEKNGLSSIKTIDFEIDKQLPPLPKVSGVSEGEVSATGFIISVEEQNGSFFTSQINGEEFTLGTEFSSAGKHKLIVTATKKRNGLKSEKRINFEIDKTSPEIPMITGVKEGSISSSGFVINVIKKDGVKYFAEINKSDYELGTEFNENGEHNLLVIATKMKNGLTSSKSLSFEIDKTPPNLPIITGVEEGKINAVGFEINVEKENEVSYLANIDGKKYELGSIFTEEGKHKIEITALKQKNGLSSKKSINFEIDKTYPEEPEVLGITDGEISSTGFNINLKFAPNTLYITQIDGEHFRVGEEYDKPGKHTIEIVAIRKRNGLRVSKIINFEIDKTYPKEPEVLGISDGEVSSKGFKIDVKKENKNSYKAEIDGKNYVFGEEFSTEGIHTLLITVTRKRNGLTKTKKINFEIDKKPPLKPSLKNLKHKEIKKEAFKIDLEKANGIQYSFLIDGKTHDINNEIKAEGIHKLEIIAKKAKNGLIKKEELEFSLFYPGSLVWRYDFDDAIDSTPSIGKDGTLYLGCYDENLYAIGENGKLKWKYKTNGIIVSSPFVGKNKNIYFGSNDKHIYSINEMGALKWKYLTGGIIESSPNVSEKGNIFFGNDDKFLYSLNSDGTLKYKLETGSKIDSHPIIDNGVIYFGSFDKNLYAVKEEKSLLWKFETGLFIQSSPVLDLEKNIYIGSTDNNLYKIDKNGKEVWRFKTNGMILSDPFVTRNNNILVGSNDKKVYKINKDGKLIWSFEAKGAIKDGIISNENENIYFGDEKGNFYSLNSNGESNWTYNCGYEIISKPVLGKNGIVYFASKNGSLFALQTKGN